MFLNLITLRDDQILDQSYPTELSVMMETFYPMETYLSNVVATSHVWLG